MMSIFELFYSYSGDDIQNSLDLELTGFAILITTASLTFELQLSSNTLAKLHRPRCRSSDRVAKLATNSSSVSRIWNQNTEFLTGPLFNSGNLAKVYFNPTNLRLQVRFL